MVIGSMRPKHVTLIAAAALTTGWLLASVVSPPVAELQVLPLQPDRAVPQPSESSATPYTEQLHLKLRSAPQPPVPRRNPFAFESSRQIRANGDVTAAPGRDAPAVEAPQPPIVTGPSLRLSGIGSTNAPAGPVWSAVMSDGRTVYLVKIGESVAGYSVMAITEDSVTIADAAGAQWKLRLR
jgi:hypothetical protein